MDQHIQKPPKRVFFAAFVVIFFSTVSAADSIGFVPSYIDGTDSQVHADTLVISSLPQLGEDTSAVAPDPAPAPAQKPKVNITTPVRIQISSIGLDLPVQNPSTRDINALDALLQNGPARYVDSAKLGADGNVIIFGHSSHLPIVHNKMFQAFNKIPDLNAGDTITVTGANGVDYLYSVTRVRSTDSSDIIPLSVDGKKLTVVTCDTLTGKSARFVMEADFIGTAN